MLAGQVQYSFASLSVLFLQIASSIRLLKFTRKNHHVHASAREAFLQRTAHKSSSGMSGLRGLLSCKGWLCSRLCLSCTLMPCSLPGSWPPVCAWINFLHHHLFSCTWEHKYRQAGTCGNNSRSTTVASQLQRRWVAPGLLCFLDCC